MRFLGLLIAAFGALLIFGGAIAGWSAWGIDISGSPTIADAAALYAQSTLLWLAALTALTGSVLLVGGLITAALSQTR